MEITLSGEENRLIHSNFSCLNAKQTYSYTTDQMHGMLCYDIQGWEARIVLLLWENCLSQVASKR